MLSSELSLISEGKITAKKRDFKLFIPIRVRNLPKVKGGNPLNMKNKGKIVFMRVVWEKYAFYLAF